MSFSLGDAKPRTQEYHGNAVKCRNCGEIIGFHQTANKTWMPVNLYFAEEHRQGIYKIEQLPIPKTIAPIYYTGIGNHHNFTPRHNCNQKIEEEMDLEWQQRKQILNIEKTVEELKVYRELLITHPQHKERWEYAIEERKWVEE
jgi:hypothetical protein